MSAAVESPARQLAVLQIGGRLFAVGLDRLDEIVDDLDVTPTPRTPAFFLGVANLRGGVIPVLDAGVRLGLGASGDAGRQYVLIRPQGQPLAQSDGQAMAVAVDRVRGVIDAKALEMTPLSEVAGLARAEEYVRGAFRCDAYESFVLCLDPDALCRFELATGRAGERPSPGRPFVPQGQGRRRETEPGGARLLPVEAAGTLYGLPLENLLRIMPHVEPVAPPAPAPGLLGLVPDGETILPLFGLRELLGAAGAPPAERPRYILVLAQGGARAGLAVDGLRRIIAAPGLASCSRAQGGPKDGALVRDAFRLDDGRLIFVLNPEALIDFGSLGLPAGAGSGVSPTAPAGRAGREDETPELHIRFGIGDETFAAPMDRIREVAPVGELTPVPRAPEHLAGLINLRGVIVPAMDLRRRLGLLQATAPGQRSEDARVLVAESNGQLSGLIVDRVHKPVRLARRQIEPMPDACRAKGGPRFIRGIARTEEGRTTLLMDVDAVIGALEDQEASNALVA